jgi:hypothetical protein
MLLALALFAQVAMGQTLARKGWAGSNMGVLPWYQQAVFYRVDVAHFADSDGDGMGDLHGLLTRLDYLASLDIDALVLSPIAAGGGFDTRLGSPDDFDALISETSRRHMRLLVELPLATTASAEQAGSLARYWLARGVAGIYCTDGLQPGMVQVDAAGMTARLGEVRRVVASSPGQRVLLLDLPETLEQALPANVAAHRRRTASKSQAEELVVNRSLVQMPLLDAASLPVAMLTAPAVASDEPESRRSFARMSDSEHNLAIAKALATVLLTTRSAPVLLFGQEIGLTAAQMPWALDLSSPTALAAAAEPDSLLAWYRRLSELRHQQASLREGTFEVLPTGNPAIVAWLRRGAKVGGVPAAPVVVVLNLSRRPVTLSLQQGLGRVGLGVSTGRLKTLAMSGCEAGNQEPASGALTLAAYGVYLGELTTQRGLKSDPALSRSRRSGR